MCVTLLLFRIKPFVIRNDKSRPIHIANDENVKCKRKRMARSFQCLTLQAMSCHYLKDRDRERINGETDKKRNTTTKTNRGLSIVFNVAGKFGSRGISLVTQSLSKCILLCIFHECTYPLCLFLFCCCCCCRCSCCVSANGLAVFCIAFYYPNREI